MIIQYKAVLKITFSVAFLINAVLKFLQLALPKINIKTSVVQNILLKFFSNLFNNSVQHMSLESMNHPFENLLERRVWDIYKMCLNKKIRSNIWDNLSYSFCDLYSKKVNACL